MREKILKEEGGDRGRRGRREKVRGSQGKRGLICLIVNQALRIKGDESSD